MTLSSNPQPDVINTIAPKHHPEYYFEDGNIIFLIENVLFRVHPHFFVRESVVFRDMLLIPSGSETTVEGISDHNPIVLQDVKSIDFERMLWMFYNESYTDYTASAEKWSSIMSLAHKWQFERMGHAAFKAYVALSCVQAVDKIAMGQRYDFPRTYLLEVYVEICTRKAPLSVEEGGKIGYETLALIAHSREEMKIRTASSPELQKRVVTNNLIDRLKSLYL